jgi:predicted ATPase/DNA-binding CsgD family transcriptional regulator
MLQLKVAASRSPFSLRYDCRVAGSSVHRGVLPVYASRFVGRRQEVADVRRLLASSRVLTLAGPPGVGKTRLALRMAEGVAPRFRDGVWIVELDGLRDPSLLAQEVARALGLFDASVRWAVDSLAQHLGGRRLLLVLDNCEHLLDACAVLVGSLMRSCPRLHFLVTSRQSLGISGETVFRVPPLSLPHEGSVDGEAMELLVARAAAVRSGQRLEKGQLDAAAELCRRLDGIPLAIELAAVRLKTLSIEQVLDRLDDRFRILAEGERAAPPHRRTLRAALDWSYALTGEDEATLWERLSVFPGSFDLSAIGEVCTDERLPTDRLLDALDGLVDKSVISAIGSGNEMRYRMLESVRDYGLEKLRSRGEEALLRTRQLDHYSRLCLQASKHLTDASQPQWLDRLESEHHNLRTALDLCLESGRPEIGCAMACDVWLYWEAKGHLTEGRRRLAALLEGVSSKDGLRARALWVAGYLALGQSDAEAAAPLLQQSLELATNMGDRASAAFATQYLGLCSLFSGDVAGAAELFRRAFEMQRQIEEPSAAFTLSDFAFTRVLTGEPAQAITLYEHALGMTENGDPWTRSHCLWGLGLATWLLGDAARAERAELDALRLAGELDERTGIALCLEALAWIASSRGDFERAARLRGAAASVWESIPRRLPVPLHELAARCDRSVRAALGSERFERLVKEGRRLERAAAVDLGLGREDRAPDMKRAEGRKPALTRRELEVARLVAEGMTDREIAAVLVISQRTAESHVQHILTKLGFKSRSQIAAWTTAPDPSGPARESP